MRKVFIVFYAIVLGTSFAIVASFRVAPSQLPRRNAPDPDSSRKNYQNFCSGCHGEEMQAFVDRKWKHGSKLEDLFKGIKYGYADEGMPSFDSAFNESEIKGLANYILSGIEKTNGYQFQNAPTENRFSSKDINFKLDTVARGFNIAWGMAFLPNGDILFTEKSGKIFLSHKKGILTEIRGGPEVLAEGQGGLLDIALHPNFKKNRLVYLTYSAFKKTDSGTLATTAVMRAELKGDSLINQKTIFEALPYAKTRHHYGSRIIFGKDGKLYITVGERGNERVNPQTVTNDLGKVHRINDDGTIPEDNPFVNTPGAKASIYSYGHRNPQGMQQNPFTGDIWLHEHGPRGGDELNLVKKGANYGWPVITYGINYNGKVISNISAKEGMEQPLHYWTPSIAPSGMCFITGKKYPRWEGNLLVGSLRFKYLNLCHLEKNKATSEEMLLKNIGRVRDVRMGPDGYIYVSVESPGYIFRLVPMR